MHTYVILMRGINVGGKNKVSMAELKVCLEKLGFESVKTYINSGNVIVHSKLAAGAVSQKIETALPSSFKLDSSIVKILAIEATAYAKIVHNAPRGFGEDPDHYRYNTLFLIDFSVKEAMQQIDARDGVDKAWPGDNVLYFRNSIAEASKSRLSKITGQPVYQSLTIRNWNTTTKLLALLEASAPQGR